LVTALSDPSRAPDRQPEPSGSGRPAAAAPDPAHCGPLTLFSYTQQELTPLYRAVMRLFLEAKERYRLQFRPGEVAAELLRIGHREEVDRAALDRALDQLVAWGNLRRSHDTLRVTTLEDFRRRHFLYQMTAAGEAAERAVGEVVAALASSGSLQRVMLGALLRSLSELAGEMAEPAPRPERLYEHLFNAGEQFRALTENAGVFLARLHEALDTGEVDAPSFLLYKQAVLEYLEQFVQELAEVAPRIAGHLGRIEAAGAERMAGLAARADQTPTPEGRRDRAEELARRFHGMVVWFRGDGREPPTVEALRGAARSAVARILVVLERLQEMRFRRVNRTADLVRLAAWFDALGGAEDGRGQAHRLFQDAFGLFGARHLSGLHEDPDAVAAGASWWQALPVPVPPALRATGRNTATGRPGRVMEHAEAKRFLIEKHRRERLARERALARFAGRGAVPLDGLPRLDGDELAALLGLLSRLLSAPPAAGVRQALSADGLLRLRLVEPAAGELAVIESDGGRLTLPAYLLTVEDAAAAPREAPELRRTAAR
jgi:uncharacterized protein (TIGR02677 family)